MARRALIWGICIVALCALVRGYALRDPDSLLYEWIARNMQSQPLREWIAPRFPIEWPTAHGGLFAEHFACFFWPAALLGKLGVRGALCANFLWVLAGYALLFRLAKALSGVEAAWIAVVFYAVSPIGLQYLVRANHEPALLCAYLGALWCGAEERPRPVLLALFLLLAVAIKGGLGLAIFPVVAVATRRRADWLGLLLGLALSAAFVGLYEIAFRRVTGQDFLALYVHRQLEGVLEKERLGALQKLENPFYYAGSIAWFALPGSLALVVEWARRRRLDAPVVRALAPAAACVALLSLMSRRAVRYVFPAYALTSLAGAQLVSEHAKGFMSRHARLLEPALAALLFAAAAARVALG